MFWSQNIVFSTKKGLLNVHFDCENYVYFSQIYFFITWYQFWQRIYACIGDKIYPQFIVYIFSLNLFLFKFFFILRLYFPPRELPDIKAGAKNPFSAGVTMKWIYLTWWNPGLNIYSQNINKIKKKYYGGYRIISRLKKLFNICNAGELILLPPLRRNSLARSKEVADVANPL